VYVVIVSGWRGATDAHEEQIFKALRWVGGTVDVQLRHGRCPYGGVDLIADRLARSWGWEVVEFPAEIRAGRVLGPARNRRMVRAQPKAHLLVAFPGPGSAGTWNCVREASAVGIPSRIYPLESP